MVSAFSFVCCRSGRVFYVMVFAICGVVIIFVLCVWCIILLIYMLYICSIFLYFGDICMWLYIYVYMYMYRCHENGETTNN